MCHNRAMRAHLSTLVLALVAVVLGIVAYLKDPGLLMGWRLVAVRVVPSLAFAVMAGWLVKVFYQE